MIEFTQWDSYWNNFNNWDEALLSDSNRPRDEFGLRINPWRQMDKWDWRWTNKNRYLDQSIVRWAMILPWNSTAFYWCTWYQLNLYMDLKGKLNFADYTKYDWSVIKASDVEEAYKTYNIWDLAWNTKDWRLVIPEDWSYFIHYYVEFLYSNSHNVNDAYKNFTWLTSYDKKWVYQWVFHFWNMPRLNTQDVCWASTIQDLKKWEQLWIVASHSKNWENVLIAGTIIAMKLS